MICVPEIFSSPAKVSYPIRNPPDCSRQLTTNDRVPVVIQLTGTETSNICLRWRLQIIRGGLIESPRLLITTILQFVIFHASIRSSPVYIFQETICYPSAGTIKGRSRDDRGPIVGLSRDNRGDDRGSMRRLSG